MQTRCKIDACWLQQNMLRIDLLLCFVFSCVKYFHALTLSVYCMYNSLYFYFPDIDSQNRLDKASSLVHLSASSGESRFVYAVMSQLFSVQSLKLTKQAILFVLSPYSVTKYFSILHSSLYLIALVFNESNKSEFKRKIKHLSRTILKCHVMSNLDCTYCNLYQRN